MAINPYEAPQSDEVIPYAEEVPEAEPNKLAGYFYGTAIFGTVLVGVVVLLVWFIANYEKIFINRD
jgi:hypothetical protein